MAHRVVGRTVVALAWSVAPLPLLAADHPRRWGVVILLILAALGLLTAVARAADNHVRWKRNRFRTGTGSPGPLDPEEKSQRGRGFWRVVRYAALAVAVLALARMCVRPRDDYPDDWPWIAPIAFGGHGHCADIEGDYTDIDAEFPIGFSAESPSARWRDHHARIEQSADGRTIRVELGLNATGIRAARGEIKALAHESPRYQGYGRSFVLREHTHYECRGRWIYSVAGHDSGDDSFRHVDLRMTRDVRGGLVVGDTVEWATSVGWADSRRIPTGHTSQTRWRRYPARPSWDAGRVRELQTLRFVATPYRNASAVVTRLRSYYDVPLCMRMESWLVFQRETHHESQPLGYDEGRQPGEIRTCPEGSGRVDPMDGVSPQLLPPEPGMTPVYVIHWAIRDTKPLLWHTIRVEDVRRLPTIGETTLDD